MDIIIYIYFKNICYFLLFYIFLFTHVKGVFIYVLLYLLKKKLII